MKTNMKLYGHEDSGHAYKVALALTLSELPYDYEWVDIWRPCYERPAEFRENSRWCEVPLLMIDGKALIQSGAILEYLCRHYGIFGGGVTFDRASEWVLWEANRIGMCLPQLIQAQITPEEFTPDVIDWLKARLAIDQKRLDDALAESDFLGGEAPSIGDIAVFGYVYKSIERGLNFTPNIMRWSEKICAMEYFQTPESLLASPK